MSDHNCKFQVTIMTEDGLVLALTEWSDNKDLCIELVDRINHRTKVLRATIATKSSGYANMSQPLTLG